MMTTPTDVRALIEALPSGYFASDAKRASLLAMLGPKQAPPTYRRGDWIVATRCLPGFPPPPACALLVVPALGMGGGEHRPDYYTVHDGERWWYVSAEDSRLATAEEIAKARGELNRSSCIRRCADPKPTYAWGDLVTGLTSGPVGVVLHVDAQSGDLTVMWTSTSEPSRVERHRVRHASAQAIAKARGEAERRTA